MLINFNGINKIRITGYKSIVDESIADGWIELRPITVLAGANSSGKSSVMQSLLLLKQTLEEKNAAIPLWLNGNNVLLTQYEQIRPKFEYNKKNEFEIGVENRFLRATSIFRYSEKAKQICIRNTNFDFSPYVQSGGGDNFKKVEFILSDTTSDDEAQAFVVELSNHYYGIDCQKQYELKRDSCFLAVRPKGLQNGKASIPGGPDGTFSPAGSFRYDLLGIIHLPGLRDDPFTRQFQRIPIVRLPADDEPTYFFKGKFPQYTASLIEAWENEKNGRFKRLERYVRDLYLSTAVGTRLVDDSFLEIVVGWHPTAKPREKGDMVNIADVGCGISQVLPILVALTAAKSSQVVYIEQPEIHLHPKVITKLVDVIAEAVSRGVKVIVETHSDLWLLSLQTIIARRMSEGDLAPENVILYWFEKVKNHKDGIVGSTKITKGTLDETGNYDNWPEDFISTAMEQQRKFLDAMMARNEKKEDT